MDTEDIGSYDFLPFRRGDTFTARALARTEQPAGTPKAIASARMELRTLRGVLIHRWDFAAGTITITGAGSNLVTIAAVAPETTAVWPVGKDHKYDLEVVWASGGTRTILKGILPVVDDVTKPVATP